MVLAVGSVLLVILIIFLTTYFFVMRSRTRKISRREVRKRRRDDSKLHSIVSYDFKNSSPDKVAPFPVYGGDGENSAHLAGSIMTLYKNHDSEEKKLNSLAAREMRK